MLSDSEDAFQTCPYWFGWWCLLSFREHRPSLKKKLTELSHFNLSAYGLPSFCLRLVHIVTSINPRLDIEWSGSLLLKQDLHLQAAKRLVAHLKSILNRYMGSNLKDSSFFFQVYRNLDFQLILSFLWGSSFRI